jgi:hypothetical protein
VGTRLSPEQLHRRRIFLAIGKSIKNGGKIQISLIRQARRSRSLPCRSSDASNRSTRSGCTFQKPDRVLGHSAVRMGPAAAALGKKRPENSIALAFDYNFLVLEKFTWHNVYNVGNNLILIYGFLLFRTDFKFGNHPVFDLPVSL